MSRRVLFIGLDGATFSVLDPLFEKEIMPFLGKLAAEGVRAPLRTVIPPLTPPAWTSLMTGRSPGHHGVFDFFRMESPTTRHIHFMSSDDVRCETIWSMANRNGMQVNVLNFPLMFPPPKLQGNVVAGWVPWKQFRLAVHPPELFDRLKQLPGFNPRELAMDIKLEEKATEGCGHTEYESWIELHIRRERNWLEVARHLMTESPAALTAVMFDGVDKLQHLCWRFIENGGEGPFTEEWEHRVRDLCMTYFRRLDGVIEQLCELAGEDTNVMFSSDHGFGPTWEVFNVNQWLADNGYLKWRESARQDAQESATLGVGRVARHTYLMDWDHTTAFATTPTSNGIYIAVDHDGKSPGVAPSDYADFRDELARKLLAFKAPDGGSVVDKIWTRDEAFSGPYGEGAPDLTLALRDCGLVSILPSETVLNPRDEIAGTHRPVGVFLANGPDIRAGSKIAEMSILDVAPTILYSLGMAVPENLEGRVPDEVFHQRLMSERPVQTGAPAGEAGAAPEERSPQAEPVLDDEGKAVMVERLRQLGYIE